MKMIFKISVILVLGILLSQCANQQPPPGGPKDMEPPKILEISPVNGTLNFTEDSFEITFSEYVDKLSLLDALFISPEIKNIEYDWTGTSVEISFDDTLLANTTYTVSIGSSIKDLNNKNPMEEAVNFSFSTGNRIDIGSIGGKVFDEDLTGTMIFAYQKVDTFANPVLEKARNITQVGENGEYKLMGLKNGKYRVIAVKDEGGNRLYNIGDDMYGVANTIVVLSDSQNNISGIDFRLTKEDTIPPFISNITMTDKHHLSVEYSEGLDSSKVDASNFFIYDSTSQRRIKAKFFYKGNARKFEYFISFEDTLDFEGDNYLIAKNVFDRFNNKTIVDSFQFVINEKPDTVAAVVKSISTSFDGNKVDFLNPSFQILFTDGIEKTDLEYGLLLDDYDWKIIKNDNTLFEILFLEELEPNQKVEFKINHNKIGDAAGNILDSVQSFSIQTLTGREFSGLSGSVNIGDDDSNLIVVIENDAKSKSIYQTKVNKDGTYNFDRILPGFYSIWMYYDRNKDGKYNFGKVTPFEFSEKFFVHPDTLNLRARWPVGDVEIGE